MKPENSKRISSLASFLSTGPDINAYNSRNEMVKSQFLLDAKKFLIAVAEEIGFVPSEYSISVCKGGIGVSGEVYFNSEHFHMCVYGSFVDFGLLYRYQEKPGDCRGTNNWIDWNTIAKDPTVLIDRLVEFIQ